MKPVITLAAGLIALGILAYLWKSWRLRRDQRRFREAVESFPQQHDLGQVFIAAANRTGKPRGLRWKSCELVGEPLFATDHQSGDIYGLSGATIAFEAIPGGDMEDVEAVGDIRYVTAIFVYRDNQWQSDGRAIFNLEPAQAVERLAQVTKTIEH